MTDSILVETKKILGIDASYTAFDLDIMTHINSVFNTLHQLGVGPPDGFSIADDSALWATYTENNVLLNNVKTYVYLRVRLLFDPPATSFHLAAMQEQIKELEWRINVYREGVAWATPTTP